MAHFPIRNQRAFLFRVNIADNEQEVFVLGPLQPGEELEQVFIQLHTQTANGILLIQVGVHDEVITNANLDTDASLLTNGGLPLAILFEGLRDRRSSMVIPIHRAATDRERYFAVRLDTTALNAAVGGSVSFSVLFFPQHVNPT